MGYMKTPPLRIRGVAKEAASGFPFFGSLCEVAHCFSEKCEKLLPSAVLCWRKSSDHRLVEFLDDETANRGKNRLSSPKNAELSLMNAEFVWTEVHVYFRAEVRPTH